MEKNLNSPTFDSVPCIKIDVKIIRMSLEDEYTTVAQSIELYRLGYPQFMNGLFWTWPNDLKGTYELVDIGQCRIDGGRVKAIKKEDAVVWILQGNHSSPLF